MPGTWKKSFIKHPQIKAAGVVGVPDPKVGNVIKAYVVLEERSPG